MIFHSNRKYTKAEKKSAYEKAKRQWHEWFAWFPVEVLDDGKTVKRVWLNMVMRKGMNNCFLDHTWIYEYKEIQGN